jgi:hypothetical protein
MATEWKSLQADLPDVPLMASADGCLEAGGEVTILEGLETRNPPAGAAARAAMRTATVRALYGASTQAAALAWPYLDHQARMEWVWVCEFVQRTWIRGMALEEDDAAGVTC